MQEYFNDFLEKSKYEGRVSIQIVRHNAYGIISVFYGVVRYQPSYSYTIGRGYEERRIIVPARFETYENFPLIVGKTMGWFDSRQPWLNYSGERMHVTIHPVPRYPSPGIRIEVGPGNFLYIDAKLKFYSTAFEPISEEIPLSGAGATNYYTHSLIGGNIYSYETTLVQFMRWW